MLDTAALAELTPAQRVEAAELLDELARRRATRMIETMYPEAGPLRRELYPRHMEFFRSGAGFRERCALAANRVGKTVGMGGYETVLHLTGRYPDWWEGKRFDKPVRGWAAGKTNETTRDIIQAKLFGAVTGSNANKSLSGTGLVPGDLIGKLSWKQGVSDLLDTVAVRHVSGGWSMLGLKSYQQGRGSFEGTEQDFVWLDEEPPQDIYSECVIRTATTDGIVYITFTPLEGTTGTVMLFIGQDRGKSRHLVTATWDDVPHLDEKTKRELWESTPPHEREARAKGIPSLGSGRIFPVPEDAILVAPFKVPDFWPRINGIDFGWDHPTAAVQLAWDRDADCMYVTHAYKASQQVPAVHAAAVKAWGPWVPVAWPHDGLQHDKGSGEQIARQYANAGLKMLAERATFEDGSNGVEAGLLDMLERMQTGRWKVFSTCDAWMQEFRLYHRKDGKVVKEMDDCISASRYALMMKRKARVRPVEKRIQPSAWSRAIDAEVGW